MSLLPTIGQSSSAPLTLVVSIEGGLVKHLAASGPVRVIVLDGDLDDTTETIQVVSGAEVVVSDHEQVDIDPDFTKSVVDQIANTEISAGAQVAPQPGTRKLFSVTGFARTISESLAGSKKRKESVAFCEEVRRRVDDPSKTFTPGGRSVKGSSIRFSAPEELTIEPVVGYPGVAFVQIPCTVDGISLESGVAQPHVLRVKIVDEMISHVHLIPVGALDSNSPTRKPRLSVVQSSSN